MPYVNKEKIWTEEEKNNRINSFAKLFTNEQRDESLSVVLSLIDFILSEKVNFEKRQKAHNIIKVFLLNTDNEKSLITFWIKILEYPESKEQTEILNLIENYKPELWNKIINLLEEENNSTNKAKNEAHTQSDQNTAPSKESEQMPPESPKLPPKYYSLTYIFETLANSGKIYDFKGGKKAFFDKYAISKESGWAGNSIMKDFNFLTDKNKYTSKEKLNEYFNKDFNFNETVEKVLSIVESQNKTKVTNWIEKNVK